MLTAELISDEFLNTTVTVHHITGKLIWSTALTGLQPSRSYVNRHLATLACLRLLWVYVLFTDKIRDTFYVIVNCIFCHLMLKKSNFMRTVK